VAGFFVVPGMRGIRVEIRMANEPMFAARKAYERRLTEHGTLRRRAVGLIVIGAGCLLIGAVTGDVFTVTVGLISVGAGGIWRWYLA
jgi:hypothetical protein